MYPICTLGMGGALQGLHGIGARMSFLHAKICHASRGVAINLVAGRNGLTGSLATNQCSKKSGAISPSTFSNAFGNTKRETLVNPKKGGQDAMFKALHVPKPCAGHRRHSRRNVLKAHV